MSVTVHATCVAIRGRAVLIQGASGSGKSDLALRLIDRGAMLVSDDRTVLTPEAGRLIASAPPTIRGLIEVRGIGIVAMPTVDDTPVALIVTIDPAPDRMPAESATRRIAGVDIPFAALPALESSAAIKVELALARAIGDSAAA